MVQVDETTQGVLNQISEGFEQKGAYNLRQNGIPLCHGDSEHIKIRKKEDKPGIDILIDGETKGEKVFIPVVVSVSGMTDLVSLTVMLFLVAHVGIFSNMERMDTVVPAVVAAAVVDTAARYNRNIGAVRNVEIIVNKIRHARNADDHRDKY